MNNVVAYLFLLVLQYYQVYYHSPHIDVAQVNPDA